MKKAALFFLLAFIWVMAPMGVSAQNAKPCDDVQYLKGIKGLDVFVILAGDNVPDKGALVATLKSGTEELLRTIGLKDAGPKEMAAPSKEYGILFVHVISKKLYDGSYARVSSAGNSSKRRLRRKRRMLQIPLCLEPHAPAAFCIPGRRFRRSGIGGSGFPGKISGSTI